MTTNPHKKDYFSVRYQPDPNRKAVWKEIIRALSPHIPHDSMVLEIGPGYCDFINQVSARKKVAVDINPNAGIYADSDVEFRCGDFTQLSAMQPGSHDLVFASNLLEHLEKPEISGLLQSAYAVLKPRGKLVLLQPNFRYSYRQYYDDYTHITPFTDKSLCGLVESEGFQVTDCVPRFLPLSMNTATWLPRPWWMIRLYLNLPVRPFAKQMLVVAEKPVE